jgi:hypothetical protein
LRSALHQVRRALLQPDHLALLALALVTVWLTNPIIWRLGSVVIGRPVDDVFEAIWYLEWYKRALFDLHVSPLFVPGVFFPAGFDLRLAVSPPLFPLLLTPVTALIGSVATYNLALLAGCLIAGWGVYRAARLLGAWPMAAVLSGVAYAFYPNREVYLNGFFNFQLGSAFLPWVLVGLLRAEAASAQRWRGWAFAGLAYGLSISGAWQQAIIGLPIWIIFGIRLIWRSVRSERVTRGVVSLPVTPVAPAAHWPSFIPGAAAAVGVALLVTAPQLLPAWGLQKGGQVNVGFPLEQVAGTAVYAERLLTPGIYNPLFRDLSLRVMPLRNGEDGIVYFGFINLALAGYALYARRRPTQDDGSVAVGLPGIYAALLVLVLVSVVLMLGPAFGVLGTRPLLPSALSHLIYPLAPELAAPDGRMPVLLPALWLYRLAAPLRAFHHYGRFGQDAILGIGLLAALGLTALTRRCTRPRRWGVGLLALAVLLIEFNTQPLVAATDVNTVQRPVDAWLAAHPDGKAMIELPLQINMTGRTLYYTLFHQHPIVHGYAQVRPAQTDQLFAELASFPSDSALDALAAVGVRYVLYDVVANRDAAADLDAMRANPRLRQVAHFTSAHFYALETFVYELAPDRSP